MFYERNSSDNSEKFFLQVGHTTDNAKVTGNRNSFPGTEECNVLPETVVGTPPGKSLRRHLIASSLQGASAISTPVARSRRDTETQPSAPSDRINDVSLPMGSAKTGTLNRPLHVLIADDNLLIRTSLLNLFEKWGSNCSICENGQQAWEKLQEQRFDLVLIDLQMPLMDGHEVVACLRANDQNPNQQVPIVAMAGTMDETARAQMLTAGASTCLSKPLDPRQLYKIVTERKMIPEYRQVSFYTDVIDYAALQQMYQNDTAHLDNMLGIFLRNTPTALRSMENAIEQKDWNNLERQVHKIRPTFTMVGLQRISEIAEELETLLSEQKERVYHNIYTNFNRFHTAVKQSLKIIAEQRESIQDSLK